MGFYDSKGYSVISYQVSNLSDEDNKYKNKL